MERRRNSRFNPVHRLQSLSAIASNGGVQKKEVKKREWKGRRRRRRRRRRKGKEKLRVGGKWRFKRQKMGVWRRYQKKSLRDRERQRWINVSLQKMDRDRQ